MTGQTRVLSGYWLFLGSYSTVICRRPNEPISFIGKVVGHIFTIRTPLGIVNPLPRKLNQFGLFV